MVKLDIEGDTRYFHVGEVTKCDFEIYANNNVIAFVETEVEIFDDGGFHFTILSCDNSKLPTKRIRHLIKQFIRSSWPLCEKKGEYNGNGL